MLTENFIERYGDYHTVGELYTQFGYDFNFKVDSLGVITDVESAVINKLHYYYGNNDLSTLRCFIEDKVIKAWEKFIWYTGNSEEYIIWKELDDMYTFFYEKYLDLIEMNIA